MNNNLWRDLYVHHSEHYERLVQAEDYQGQLLAALGQIAAIDSKALVEFGAGTGRITTQLLPQAGYVSAFDLTPAMLRIAHRKLKQSGYSNWQLGVADSRAVPVPAGWADIAVEGWSFVQIMTWHKENWQQEVGRAIKEMLRAVRPGGVACLIETLGTGETSPRPPELFTTAYDYFEKDWHFSSTWIRTDFRFPTLAEAQAIIGPVFGEAMLERMLVSEEGVILPECTGIWWRYV